MSGVSGLTNGLSALEAKASARRWSCVGFSIAGSAPPRPIVRSLAWINVDIRLMFPTDVALVIRWRMSKSFAMPRLLRGTAQATTPHRRVLYHAGDEEYARKHTRSKYAKIMKDMGKIFQGTMKKLAQFTKQRLLVASLLPRASILPSCSVYQLFRSAETSNIASRTLRR